MERRRLALLKLLHIGERTFVVRCCGCKQRLSGRDEKSECKAQSITKGLELRTFRYTTFRFAWDPQRALHDLALSTAYVIVGSTTAGEHLLVRYTLHTPLP